MQRRLITVNVHENAMSWFDYTDYYTPYFKSLSNEMDSVIFPGAAAAVSKCLPSTRMHAQSMSGARHWSMNASIVRCAMLF